MFYSNNLSETYRLGDIIQGFSEILPTYTESSCEFTLKISQHTSFVILTPCCSIESFEAVIVPLKRIDSKLLMSDYLIRDFLKLNKPISKKEAIGDIVFNRMGEEERYAFENATPNYEYTDLFIYDSHELLQPYEISKKRSKDETISIETNKYMICFKDVMKIHFSLFNRANNSCTKLLELDPVTREDLRKKISKYYSQIPEEDLPFIL